MDSCANYCEGGAGQGGKGLGGVGKGEVVWGRWLGFDARCLMLATCCSMLDALCLIHEHLPDSPKKEAALGRLPLGGDDLKLTSLYGLGFGPFEPIRRSCRGA